jgi:hypothetical protein
VTRLVAAGAVAGVALVSLTACADTTVDTSLTIPPTADATTTVFAPSGTTAELLDQLVAASGRLSDLIIANDGAVEALVRIEALWSLVGEPVADERPDLVPGFESAIGLLRTGVERRRPADADKAYNNLRALAAAYDSGGG